MSRNKVYDSVRVCVKTLIQVFRYIANIKINKET